MTVASTTARLPRPAGTDSDLLEQYAYQFGRSYDSYLATEPGRQCFWSRGRQGVVAFVRIGRYLKISGGLLAPDEHKADLLRQLVQHADRRKLVLSFYNIADDELPLFRACGFQVTKWGEDAIVDLTGCTWEGKAFEWVRRQSHYCLRQGLVLSECNPRSLSSDESSAVMLELRAVAAEPLVEKPQAKEMTFLEGAFDPARLGRKRLFIARGGEGHGRIEGLLVCNPCSCGAQWAFELYRHRRDAVRGTIAFLMYQTMQFLQREGVERVSLCLIPGQRCSQSLPGDSCLARWGLVVGSKYFNFIFNTAGPSYFKSRFRPRFESRSICVRPKVTLGSALAFIRVLGVLELDWKKLLRAHFLRLWRWLCRARA